MVGDGSGVEEYLALNISRVISVENRENLSAIYRHISSHLYNGKINVEKKYGRSVKMSSSGLAISAAHIMVAPIKAEIVAATETLKERNSIISYVLTYQQYKTITKVIYI